MNENKMLCWFIFIVYNLEPYLIDIIALVVDSCFELFDYSLVFLQMRG